MIEKVVNCIDELDQPHLKLMVMHDFMWALIEEQASNRAHAHWERNRDSGWDIQVMDSEVHDISQGIIDWALWPGRPTVCEYMKDQALTVNVLWEIAYGVCHEAFYLYSLEDFNATEVDLMGMKDHILAMWKSRDARRTSSLRPTLISSTDPKGQGSTLGRTFIPRGATASSGALCGPGGGMGEASLPFFRPLAPPPGIPSTSGLSPYIQGLLPTSFPMVGMPTKYNFDPITGWPLKALITSTYSLPSQPLGASFLTPTSPCITGLSTLPGLSQEEHPLVVGSPSRSSQVVVGGRIPTVTVSSATAETTLSASPNTAPRISTSCSNVTGGDIHRVIWQHPHSPSNKTLAGAGVSRGLARRPARVSSGRGQVLVNMLTEKGGDRGQALAAKLEGSGAGRGQSISSPQVGRPEQRGRQVDAHTEASLPPPITMHLDHQGPPVTYSEAASRLPQRMVISSSELLEYDVWLKMAACEKEKEAAWATLDQIQRQEWEEEAAQKKQEHELRRIRQRDAGHRLEREGAQWQEEYNCERRASGACPNPITDPLGMVRVWMVQERDIQESHMGWGLMECQPHGPSTVSFENGLLMGPG